MSDAESIPNLLPENLKADFEAGKPLVLLDVREDFERAFAKIQAPASVVDVHLPMGQIPGRLEELRAIASTKPIVVYCHHGVRSLAVAEWLRRQGFAALSNLNQGIEAWSIQVDPTVPRY